MTTVYFDSKMTEFSPRQSTLELIDFSRELIEAAFAPLPPRTAQFELSVERFVEIFGPLKPHFIHHPKTAALMRDVVAELGGDLNTVYVDAPRLRGATSDKYLTAGVGLRLRRTGIRGGLPRWPS